MLALCLRRLDEAKVAVFSPSRVQFYSSMPLRHHEEKHTHTHFKYYSVQAVTTPSSVEVKSQASVGCHATEYTGR